MQTHNQEIPPRTLDRRPESTGAEKDEFKRLIAGDAKSVDYIPYGSPDPIKLSVAIVKELLCKPTKAGHLCSDADAKKFILMCRAKRLNPFEGDAFIVGYDSANGPEFSIITAHQAFLKRAELHAEYDGMESGIVINDKDGICEMKQTEIVQAQETLIGGWARVHFKNRKIPMLKVLPLAAFDKGNKFWEGAKKSGQIVKCFDGETEILTSLGFEPFRSAEGSILQVSERGLEPTEAIPFRQTYSGPMIRWNSRNGNFYVTGNHDLPVRINGDAEQKVEAIDLFSLKQRDEILMPLTAEFAKVDYPIADQFIRLAAAYLADGTDNSRSSGFSISVSRPRKIDLLRSLNLSISERERKCSGDSIIASSGREIRTILDKRCFYFSRLPEVDWLIGRGKIVNIQNALSMSPRQAKLFVDTWRGLDGYCPSSCLIGRIYTSRRDHCAALEILANVAGYSVSQRKIRHADIGGANFCLTLTNRTHIRLSKEEYLINDYHFSGEIWCVKVPTGKIIVRRHGFSHIAHNCAEADSLRSSFPTMLGGLYLGDEVSIDVSPRQTSARQMLATDPKELVGEIMRPQESSEASEGPPQAQNQAKPSQDEADEAEAGLAPLKPKEARKPAPTPWQTLAGMVTAAGFDFDTFKIWIVKANQETSQDVLDRLDGFEAMPKEMAERFIRAFKRIVPALESIKKGEA